MKKAARRRPFRLPFARDLLCGFLLLCGALRRFFLLRLWLGLRLWGCLSLLRGGLLGRLWLLVLVGCGFLGLFLLCLCLRSGLGGLCIGGRFSRFLGAFVSDELEDCHLRRVAAAGTKLHDARVAAGRVRGPGAERIGQLGDFGLTDQTSGLTAVVNVVDAAEGDEALDQRTELLGLRQRGDDALLVDQ